MGYIDETGLAEFTQNIKNYLNEKLHPNAYLAFSSSTSFTLETGNRQKNWDGFIEYSTNKSIWTTWDGTTTLTAASDGTNYNIFMRGTGNSYITGGINVVRHWVLTGTNIECKGNIETLLDYQTVQQGSHPTMSNYCYSSMFMDVARL